MKQEQNKSIRTVKSISNNVLEAEVYYSSFNLLYLSYTKNHTFAFFPKCKKRRPNWSSLSLKACDSDRFVKQSNSCLRIL